MSCILVNFGCVCVLGSGQALQVLEGLEAVAEGEERLSSTREVHPRVENEGSQL